MNGSVISDGFSSEVSVARVAVAAVTAHVLTNDDAHMEQV